MNPEPRQRDDYSERQVEAARRVLVDIGQVLGSFSDCVVVVGGWVPELLLPTAEPAHIGSIDVDLALDAAKLGDGRYAELLKLLIGSGRYSPGDKPFQLTTSVNLDDGGATVHVDVEFLAPDDVKLKKNRPKLVEGFRALRFPACAAAFGRPRRITLSGKMVDGALNSVQIQVASVSDFLIMKAHAIGGRDKPKDVYDLCYCLDHSPSELENIASDWRLRRSDPLVAVAVEILRQKFQSVDHYGPQQLAVFHDAVAVEERALHARRAFELVQRLLTLQDTKQNER